MGWLIEATNANKREERAVYRWRFQYALVDEAFTELFDMDDPAVVDASVSEGDEVVRRIRLSIVDQRWVGMTKSAADTHLETLRSDPRYGSATADWNGAGGYDVTGQKYLVDDAGWSKWIRVQALESFGGA